MKKIQNRKDKDLLILKIAEIILTRRWTEIANVVHESKDNTSLDEYCLTKQTLMSLRFLIEELENK